MRRTINILAIAIIVLSATSAYFPGTIRIPNANAVLATFPGDKWSPVGPFVPRLQFVAFTSEVPEYAALDGGTIDIVDWPLTPAQLALCAKAAITCTPGAPETGIFILDFNSFAAPEAPAGIATNWWGLQGLQAYTPVPPETTLMTVTAAVTSIREAIAHLVDKDGFIADNLPGLAEKEDYFIGGGQLEEVNKRLVAQTGSQLADLAPTCAAGPASLPAVLQGQFVDPLHNSGTGACVGVFNVQVDTHQIPAVGSPDWNAALDHFAQIGWVDTNADGIIDAATGAFPLPSTVAKAIVRSDHSPRTALGTAAVQAINQIFGKGAVDPACPSAPAVAVICKELKTIQENGAFMFDTGDSEWHIGTGGYRLGVDPDQLQTIFDSTFVGYDPDGDGVAICGGPSSNTASNYNNFCEPLYDTLARDFIAQPNFDAAVLKIPAVAFWFNRLIPSIPVYSSAAGQAFRTGWSGTVNYKGFNIGNDANVYSQLNMRRPDGTYPLCAGFPTAALKSCLRQGMRQGTNTLNPALYQTVWESWIVVRTFDSMTAADPLNPTVIWPWLVSNYDSTLNNPTLVQYGNCAAGVNLQTQAGRKTIFENACKPLDRGGGRQPYALTARYQLHNWARFHDNSRITPEDIAFSIYYQYDAKLFQFPLVQNVIGVTKVTDSILDVHFGAPAGFFEPRRAGGILILPQKYWDGDGDPHTFDTGSSITWTVTAADKLPALTGTTISGGSLFTVDPLTARVPARGSMPAKTGLFIGSGPFMCRNTAALATDSEDVKLGRGCTSTQTSILTGGTDTATLDAYDRQASPVAAYNRDRAYFRDARTFTEYDWADNDNSVAAGAQALWKVSLSDVLRINRCFGVTPGTTTPACPQLNGPRSAAYADFDANGDVSITDVQRAGRWFDESWFGTGLGTTYGWQSFVDDPATAGIEGNIQEFPGYDAGPITITPSAGTTRTLDEPSSVDVYARITDRRWTVIRMDPAPATVMVDVTVNIAADGTTTTTIHTIAPGVTITVTATSITITVPGAGNYMVYNRLSQFLGEMVFENGINAPKIWNSRASTTQFSA